MEKTSKKNIDLANMHLDFDSFKELAKNKRLSKYEKIGFPNSYRKGLEQMIFDDICCKLTNLQQEEKAVLDIGPGCSELAESLINLCQNNEHKLVFCDSEEMLELHENRDFLVKIPGMFPKTYEQVSSAVGQYDVILCYSVFHYILIDTNMWDFLDKCLMLLKPGGQFLLGDIPNHSKRKRFFASDAGAKYHKEFTNTDSNPEVEFNKIDLGKIDDAIIMSILMRVQLSGFDAYLLPQNQKLPMSNRRDDILILKP